MKMDITAYFASARPIAGDVNSCELVIPDGELMQHGGGHVADGSIHRRLTESRCNQTTMLLASGERFRRCPLVCATPDPLYLTRANHPIQLVKAPSLREQLCGEFDLFHERKANSGQPPPSISIEKSVDNCRTA